MVWPVFAALELLQFVHDKINSVIYQGMLEENL